MKKIMFACLFILSFPSLGYAKGDANLGKAEAAVCAACHGQTGVSIMPQYPNLAGQGEKYIIEQLTSIKENKRSVPEMVPFVQSLTKKNIEDIAAYFSSQDPAKGAADPKLVALGESLFRFGIKEKRIPACAACHATKGEGNFLAGFPSLAGQKTTYIITQLKNYQIKLRKNSDHSKIMQMIADRMNEHEMNAVASYLSGLQH